MMKSPVVNSLFHQNGYTCCCGNSTNCGQHWNFCANTSHNHCATANDSPYADHLILRRARLCFHYGPRLPLTPIEPAHRELLEKAMKDYGVL